MVTLEALKSVDMSEAEARRILEIFNGESTEDEEKEEAEPPVEDPTEEAQQTEAEAAAAEEPSEDSAASEVTEPDPKEPSSEEAAAEEAPVSEEDTDPEPAAVNPLAEENAALRSRVVQTGLRAAGLAAGVKPERLDALLKLADVSRIDPMAADVQEQLDAAVQSALSLVPELVIAAPAVTTGSAGMHPREPANATDPFSRGFRG